MASQQPIPPAVLDQLRRIDNELDPSLSKHNRVSMLIALCIMEGITNGSFIRCTLMELGYDGQHVAIILKKGSGSMPPEHRWYKDSDGHYRLP